MKVFGSNAMKGRCRNDVLLAELWNYLHVLFDVLPIIGGHSSKSKNQCRCCNDKFGFVK